MIDWRTRAWDRLTQSQLHTLQLDDLKLPYEMREYIERANQRLSLGDKVVSIQGRKHIKLRRFTTLGRVRTYIEPMEMDRTREVMDTDVA